MTYKPTVWLVGAGGMAVDYAKVLTALEAQTIVIGRGDRSAESFREKTGITVAVGGLEAFFATNPELPHCAIISVGVEGLADATLRLLAFGVRRILVEKPGALSSAEIAELGRVAAQKAADVLIAYNRRLYASTLRAKQIIEEDGGVKSMHFEFTEWSHVIGDLNKAEGVKPAWLLANSTHVIDLAFHLGGTPVNWHAYTAGGLDWHPASAVFAGAGQTDRGVLFSYQANWDAPGRWGVEIITAQHRLIFRPMESLQVMRKGAIAIEPIAIDDALDKMFKPGLYEQVRRFIAGDFQGLCTLDEQIDKWHLYNRIAGYAA